MPKKEVDYAKLNKLYKSLLNNEISKSEMAKEMGITTQTLNKWIDKYIIQEGGKSEEKTEEKAEIMTTDKSDNKISIFENKDFGTIRTVEIDNEPWFVGKDVARALGYGKTENAIARRVDVEDKGVTEMVTPGGKQDLTVINESGLYSLILSSKLPSAKKFKRWVTAEVLPAIRKQGAYMTKENIEKVLYNPDFLIKLATNLKAEQEKNVKLLKENQQLSTVNSVLVKETNEWNSRSLILHLIRKYGYYQCNNKFGVAWSEFYKNIVYKLHINLNKRYARQNNKQKTPLDMVRVDEWSSILKVAVAMCESAGIKTADIIDKHMAVS